MSDVVIVAFVAAIAAVVSATISAVAIVMVQRTHDLVNSRMTELLAFARAAGFAQGAQSEKDKDE